jgi:hypothetical protein
MGCASIFHDPLPFAQNFSIDHFWTFVLIYTDITLSDSQHTHITLHFPFGCLADHPWVASNDTVAVMMVSPPWADSDESRPAQAATSLDENGADALGTWR